MAENRKTRRAAAKQRKSPGGKMSAEALQSAIDRAIVDAQADRYGNVDQSLRRVLKTDADNAEALHQLGMNLARDGRAQEGLDYLRRAIKLKPDEALYWNNLAACCFSAGEMKEAASAAKRAAEIDPSYAMAWSNLGVALMRLKDHANAVQAFARSAALAAPDLQTLKSAAECNMIVEDYTAAEAYLRQAVSLEPDDAEILGNLGVVLMNRGKDEEAVSLFARAAEKEPNRFFIAFGYARALLAGGERDKALRWLRRSTSANHQSTEAWMLLAETLLDAGLTEEAVVASKQARKLAPEDPAVLGLMERLKSAIGNADDALVSRGATLRRIELGGAAPVNGVRPAGGLDVTFGKKALGESPAEAPAAQPSPGAAKPDANGVIDLSILKID